MAIKNPFALDVIEGDVVAFDWNGHRVTGTVRRSQYRPATDDMSIRLVDHSYPYALTALAPVELVAPVVV